MFVALIFSKSHNGLVTTLFLHLTDWAHGPYILHIMIQPMAYASFCGMGLNLHLSMSSQIGNIAHIIANLILWAHGLPFSHFTDWAGSPYFSPQGIKTQGSHCFSCLFMEGFPIKLVHLVNFFIHL